MPEGKGSITTACHLGGKVLTERSQIFTVHI